MSGLVRPHACGLVVILLLAGELPATAFLRETTTGGLGLYWASSSFPIDYSVDDTPAGDGAAANRTIVMGQFQQWADAACGDFSITSTPGRVPHAQAQAALDGINEIFWAATWPPDNCPTCTSAVLGLTTPWFDDTTGQISEADIAFNAQDYPYWEAQDQYNACTQTQDGCSDTASIALHEEGHFLGLGHPPVEAAVMYATWDGTPKRQLNSDDLSGVCTIYPVATPGTGTQGTGCVMDSDCATGLTCGTAESGFGPICTTTCTPGSTHCPSGTACLSIDATTNGCFPPTAAETSATIGQSCTSLPCESGLVCASPPGNPAQMTCYGSCDPTSTTSECLADQICTAVTGGGACVDNPNYGATLGESCATAPCQPNLVCFGPDPPDDYCRASCTPGPDATCPTGQGCVGPDGGSGVCVPPTLGACAACSIDSDCGAGFSCVAFNSSMSFCRTGCSSSGTCTTGSQCIAAPQAFSGDPGICSCAVDLGVTALDDACTSTEFCEAGLICVPDAVTGNSICLASCDASVPDECPNGQVCQSFGSAGAACVVSTTSVEDAGTAPVGPPPAGRPRTGCGCGTHDPATAWVALALWLATRRRRGRPV